MIDNGERHDLCHRNLWRPGYPLLSLAKVLYVLGKLLDKGMRIEDTFRQYEQVRKKKARAIVNSSWSIGKLAHMNNDLGIWLRNLIMRNLPKSSSKKQMDFIFNINYETL